MTSAQRNVGNLGLMPLNESYMPLGPRLHEEIFFYHLCGKEEV